LTRSTKQQKNILHVHSLHSLLTEVGILAFCFFLSSELKTTVHHMLLIVSELMYCWLC